MKTVMIYNDDLAWCLFIIIIIIIIIIIFCTTFFREGGMSLFFQFCSLAKCNFNCYLIYLLLLLLLLLFVIKSIPMDIVHKPIGNITCTLVLRHAINILVCCKRNERVPYNYQVKKKE